MRSLRRHRLIWFGLLILSLAVSSPWWWRQLFPTKLLLVPMMNVTACLLEAGKAEPSDASDWRQPCRGAEASAAQLIESTLHSLKPTSQRPSDWELGYTLHVPLLAMLRATDGEWQVDRPAVESIARTVRNNSRPLVLYLFGTHFSVGAPIESWLVQDPNNLAWTPMGPMSTDTYYGKPIYPWSVARTDNSVTQYRSKVIRAIADALCALPASARDRIKGITLLGEVHQLFPGFEAGMGYSGPYIVSDYSATSTMGFRRYLQSRFGSISELNRHMGSDYAAFDDIVPPGKDIRRDRLERYHEHIDSFATGQLPVTGWVHAPESPHSSQRVQIYLDGKYLADVPVKFSRQDVRAARPEFGTADLGWRYDLDFSTVRAGIHRIDLALFQVGKPLLRLGARTISVMGKDQKTPVVVPSDPLPEMLPLPPQVSAYTDEPRDQADYYFNPLAREWQAFRQTQVQQYLRHFDQLLGSTCLAQTPRYTHQIIPQFNPSWDSAKYAVEASLQATPTLRTGVSLYGEASYGSSFPEWLRQSSPRPYGVTEFHPLQAMDTVQLSGVLTRHRDQGAQFLSFFLETRWNGHRVRPEINPVAFDPDNHFYESERLYSSMQSVLGH